MADNKDVALLDVAALDSGVWREERVGERKREFGWSHLVRRTKTRLRVLRATEMCVR